MAHDAARREEAAVPRGGAFAIKPEVARRMLARARASGVVTPWVTGDKVYGSDKELHTWMEAINRELVL